MGNEIARLEHFFQESLEGGVIAYHRFLTHVATVTADRLEKTDLSTAEKESLVQEILMAVHIKRHTALPGPDIEKWLDEIIRYTISKAKHRQSGQALRAWLDRLFS